MKRIVFRSVFISSVFFSTCIAFAQAPGWQWATSAGGTVDDYPYSMCIDAAGNIYVVGSFNSTSITFGSIVLQTSGFDDMFIVKYNSVGQVIWAKSAGGTEGEYARSIAIDGLNNIYVAGYFSSDSITFGSFKLYNNSSFNYKDIFLVKYDTAGNVSWAQKGGGKNYDDKPLISVDPTNNIFLAGEFYSDTITFGSVTLIHSGSGKDIFLAKYNSLGNVSWVKSFGGLNDEFIGSLTNDHLGNIYLTGQYNSPTISFDSDTLTNIGSGDIFLVKFDTQGNKLWTKSIGGSQMDFPNSIRTDASDNVYLAGNYISDSLLLDSFQLINVQFPKSDIFLAKINSSGNYIWAKNFGGSKDENPTALAFDAVGNIYMTGSFYSDTINFGNDVLINKGGFCFPAECPDIFLTMITPNGSVNWAESFGESNYDVPKDISIDHLNNLYLTGYFYEDTLVFDSISLTAVGNYDVFLAKSALTTGIEELNKNSSELIAYPNPTSQQITFRAFSNENDKCVLRIYNSQGTTVLSLTIKNNSDLKNIDVHSFVNGIYCCDLTLNNRHFTCKISVAN